MPTHLPPESWILEGVMTTLAPAPAGSPTHAGLNIAPMGPIVDRRFEQFVFRPFATSTTYRNLKATGAGVFHVTDDVLLIARAAMGTVTAVSDVAIEPAQHVRGFVLADACRYYELQVRALDDRNERTRIEAKVVSSESRRDFFGFNRARHAVLEAAILVTRLFLTGPGPVLAELDRLQVIVDKTGSDPEHTAMSELRSHVERAADAAKYLSAEATKVD